MNISGLPDFGQPPTSALCAVPLLTPYLNAVEDAERSRAPIQKTADRLAGYLVWFALGCAVLTFIITRNLASTISVIIVAGACGIAAGTPLAILGESGAQHVKVQSSKVVCTSNS